MRKQLVQRLNQNDDFQGWAHTSPVPQKTQALKEYSAGNGINPEQWYPVNGLNAFLTSAMKQLK